MRKKKTVKRPSRNPHPAGRSKKSHRSRNYKAVPFRIPADQDTVEVQFDRETVRLTNLRKLFWSQPPITKGDLMQFYIDIAPVLLPHLVDRAMVMKRYPNGSQGPFFFMKRAPVPRPAWIEICSIEHASGNVIDFPVVRDLPSLLWIVNLGCIDLNPWYARCDDVDRPDFMHFDLDPTEGATWNQMLEAACTVHEALTGLRLPSFVKTTGSKGFHIYVPLVRGATQKEVWTVAKRLALSLAAARPDLMTAEYRIAKRPRGRVLVDYNQNAWGRTLASVYSVRPQPKAAVSTPITWRELERGVRIDDFRLDNVRQRVQRVGDLWAPLLEAKDRARLESIGKFAR